MSDIYDYTYGHVMCQQEGVCSYSTSLQETSLESEVNAADFSPRDLQMFVDSLETIARLQQAKLSSKQQRKVKQQQAQPKKRQVTCLDCSSCSSIHDDDINSFSEDSFSSEYLYDETNFGLPVQAQSTAIYSNLNTDTNTSSDSEDSGVFISSSTSASHLYENTQPLRRSSKIDSNSKCKSLKSRLLALIMKKQYVKHRHSSMDILSSTTIGEQSEDQHQHLANKSKQKSKGSKSENKFLDKAMRLLTL